VNGLALAGARRIADHLHDLTGPCECPEALGGGLARAVIEPVAHAL